MKKFTLAAAIMLCAVNPATLLNAQEQTLSPEYKSAAIERLTELINEHYVFPDVARQTGEHLKKQLKAGLFDSFSELKPFADALTREVQSVNHDKHMRIRPAPPREAPADTPERLVEDKLNQMADQRANKAGFREVKRLEGNIGYLDLRGFAPVEMGAPVADRYMGLLAGSDAIIIDLRKNGGGSPGMVQYLCSYFFDQHVHLNSLYWREGDQTQEFWTLDKVGGDKMPDVPLFILTSSYTFSGAEEFCYNMQTRKRATLVGETTGGGANPGGGFPLNTDLFVFIPTGRAINPVTNTNWEGAGVEPEVNVPAEEALDKAVELAAKAAEVYRQNMRDRFKSMFTELINLVEKYPAGTSDDAVFQHLQQCRDASLLDEQDINGLGYEYLMRFNKPATAEVIFNANTRLFPNSANVFDSYGEALLANGKAQEATQSYKKAVQLAEANEDPNLELFRTNLKTAEQKAGKRP